MNILVRRFIGSAFLLSVLMLCTCKKTPPEEYCSEIAGIWELYDSYYLKEVISGKYPSYIRKIRTKHFPYLLEIEFTEDGRFIFIIDGRIAQKGQIILDKSTTSCSGLMEFKNLRLFSKLCKKLNEFYIDTLGNLIILDCPVNSREYDEWWDTRSDPNHYNVFNKIN